jgi:hypothetical protein
MTPHPLTTVMTGLDPAIHGPAAQTGVDDRVKPGHDEVQSLEHGAGND